MPTISDFSLRLFLLFFPGLICTYVVDALTIHRPRQPLFFLLQAFVSGLSAYLIYWFVHTGYHAWFLNTGVHTFLYNLIPSWLLKLGPLFPDRVIFLDALRNPSVRIAYREIVLTCFIAIGLGLGLTWVSTYKIPYRIVRKCRLSKKLGELDIWGYSFNIPAPEAQWATIRDLANDLAYDGWVQAFSDDSEHAEVYLRDVEVYRNSTAESLYKVGAIYLALPKDSISVEFRGISLTNEQANQEEHNDRTKSEARGGSKDPKITSGGDDQEGRSQSSTNHATPRSPSSPETGAKSTSATIPAATAEAIVRPDNE